MTTQIAAVDDDGFVQSEADLLAMIMLDDDNGPARLPVIAVLQCMHILIEKGHAPPLPAEWFDRTLPARWRVSAQTIPGDVK